MQARFFSPAPYPADEAIRQQTVQRLLQRPLPVATIQALVERASDVFDTRYAAMTLLDGDRQWIAASKAMNVSVTSRAAAFCGHTIRSDAPLIVRDAPADVRFAGNPLVHGPAQIRSYVGTRLVVAGAAVGALCVLDDSPMGAPGTMQLEQLNKLASEIVACLESELATRDGQDKR